MLTLFLLGSIAPPSFWLRDAVPLLLLPVGYDVAAGQFRLACPLMAVSKQWLPRLQSEHLFSWLWVELPNCETGKQQGDQNWGACLMWMKPLALEREVKAMMSLCQADPHRCPVGVAVEGTLN